MQAAHDYRAREATIPLPATMMMMLSFRTGAENREAKSRLYSPYPFPWRRQTGGLRDGFGQDAWAFLSQNPNTPFFRFSRVDGDMVLRYATADVLESNCVSCHNTYPGSSKTDWWPGDVRGILEVDIPLSGWLENSLRNIFETVVLFLLMLLFMVFVVGIALRHWKNATAEARHATDLLDAALSKEREYNTLQRQFVSMMSHEVRTPLAIIDGTAQRMTRHAAKLTPEILEQRIDTIRNSVKRMTELIESSLSAARIEAGTITKRLEQTDLGGLIATICESHRKLIAPREILVDVGALHRQIYVDPSLLDQVINNLVSNAIKYAPGDSPIEVKGWTERGHAVFSVRDYGLGIPEKDLAKLFTQFFRAGTSTGIAGTGIGLHLAKHFVELHDGTIDVVSVEGEGSTFTVRLPLGQSPELRSEEVAPEPGLVGAHP